MTSVEHGGLAVSAFERDPTFDLILMDLKYVLSSGCLLQVSACADRVCIVQHAHLRWL